MLTYWLALCVLLRLHPGPPVQGRHHSTWARPFHVSHKTHLGLLPGQCGGSVFSSEVLFPDDSSLSCRCLCWFSRRQAGFPCVAVDVLEFVLSAGLALNSEISGWRDQRLVHHHSISVLGWCKTHQPFLLWDCHFTLKTARIYGL